MKEYVDVKDSVYVPNKLMSSVWTTAESLLRDSEITVDDDDHFQDDLTRTTISRSEASVTKSFAFTVPKRSAAESCSQQDEPLLLDNFAEVSGADLGIKPENDDNDPSNLPSASDTDSSDFDEESKPIQDSAQKPLSTALISQGTSIARTSRGVGRPRGSKNASGSRGRGGRGHLPPAVAEGLARHEAVQLRKYRAKYRQLKALTRSLVLENAVLCDLTAEAQQKLIIESEKRKFLLKKYYAIASAMPHIADNPFRQLDHDTLRLLDSRLTAAGSNGSNAGSNGSNAGSTESAGDSGSNAAANDASACNKQRSQTSVKRSRGLQSGSGRPGSASCSSSAKSKRLCPPITLDSAGRPLFPIVLGPLTIHSLGEIVSERPAYHRSHVIYPVGFCSSRTYASVSNPLLPTTYTCKILDDGAAPRFELVVEEPDTGEERIFSSSSATGCLNAVLSAMTAVLTKDILRSVLEDNCVNDKGLRFFGLSHPSVQNVLQACPGARKCSSYNWIKFEVCRSEADVEKVLEAEKDISLSHDTLLRVIAGSQALV